MRCLLSYSSVVDAGMCSGTRLSRRLEQSTTLDSQRHLAGQTGSLLQSLLSLVSSVPAANTTRSSSSLAMRRGQGIITRAEPRKAVI